jgi:hypothetical protein
MTPAVRESMQVPRPTALHRGGRSRAQTYAGTFFEFPAHPSAFTLVLQKAAKTTPRGLLATPADFGLYWSARLPVPAHDARILATE